jgi:hypothetical protein
MCPHANCVESSQLDVMKTVIQAAEAAWNRTWPFWMPRIGRMCPAVLRTHWAEGFLAWEVEKKQASLIM